MQGILSKYSEHTSTFFSRAYKLLFTSSKIQSMFATNRACFKIKFCSMQHVACSIAQVQIAALYHFQSIYAGVNIQFKSSRNFRNIPFNFFLQLYNPSVFVGGGAHEKSEDHGNKIAREGIQGFGFNSPNKTHLCPAMLHARRPQRGSCSVVVFVAAWIHCRRRQADPKILGEQGRRCSPQKQSSSRDPWRLAASPGSKTWLQQFQAQAVCWGARCELCRPADADLQRIRAPQGTGRHGHSSLSLGLAGKDQAVATKTFRVFCCIGHWRASRTDRTDAGSFIRRLGCDRPSFWAGRPQRAALYL